MNFLTVTQKNKKSTKYNITVDLAVLERIAGSLGLFKEQFVKDMKKSVADMKAGRVIEAKGIDRL